MENEPESSIDIEAQEYQERIEAEEKSNQVDSVRRSAGALPLAMAIMASAGEVWPGIGPCGGRFVRRRSSQAERYDPDRPKTEEDIERMEAARLKRERKAKRKQKS